MHRSGHTSSFAPSSGGRDGGGDGYSGGGGGGRHPYRGPNEHVSGFHDGCGEFGSGDGRGFRSGRDRSPDRSKVNDVKLLIGSVPRTANRQTAQIKLVASHQEVYSPCDDSFLLVDALLAEQKRLLALEPRICLEIGCGSGYVITSLALMLKELGSRVQFFATDINVHAVETTCLTLEAHGVHAEVVAANIASGLDKRLAGMVDLLVVNPPYVSTPEDEVGTSGISSSWAGGINGRQVIDRILDSVDGMLSKRGRFFLLTSQENDPLAIARLMNSRGYASNFTLKRCTDEETLTVLKFWREETQVTTEGSSGIVSFFSHLKIGSHSTSQM